MKNFDDIKPSKEQENCINFNSGDLLVNGVPGAGKSIVLLKRALNFYRASTSGERNVVLLTTFNNTLNDYIKDVFQQADIDESRMKIITMDSLCWKIHSHYFGWTDYLDDQKERKRYVAEALQNHFQKSGKKHRFYDINEEFWCEEFLWIKQKNIRTLKEYLDAERAGRGGSVRITREERKIVLELFQEYCEILKKYRKADQEDIYTKIISSNIDLSTYKYKYILVDEAQDLSFVKLRVAKMLAKDFITIAADKAQKIYNTGFTWKELGIDIRGNSSKTLHKTFRSTKQIVQLAESLSEVNRARDKDKAEYTDPVMPTILGTDYPYIIKCSNSATEKSFLIQLISNSLKSEVTVGLLYRNYLEKQELVSCLSAGDIKYEEIKKNSDWSLRRPGVKLVTLHSSKGLEFDIVIIPFFNNIYYPLMSDMEKADSEQIEELKAKERNLLYVGMTRAKSTLYLTYSGSESPFLSEFDPMFYNYCSSYGTEIEKPLRSFEPAQISKGEPLLVKKNDTITAHVEGETKERTFLGAKVVDPDNWVFIGKTFGDKVKAGGASYIVDAINGNTKDSPNVDKSAKKRPAEKTWDDILPQIISPVREYAKKLKNTGFPVASTVGSELMGADGDVIAEAELAWEQHKIVFLRNDQKMYRNVWEKEGWKVILETDSPALSLFE